VAAKKWDKDTSKDTSLPSQLSMSSINFSGTGLNSMRDLLLDVESHQRGTLNTTVDDHQLVTTLNTPTLGSIVTASSPLTTATVTASATVSRNTPSPTPVVRDLVTHEDSDSSQ
jgi:hypothetical protein